MNKFQLIVLMAGKSTRLYPLTFGLPKCLLSVCQKPSIYNMLIPLINQGLDNVTFVVNVENKAVLQDFMNNSFKNLNIQFNYVVQEEVNGPGSALRLVEPLIEKPTLVLLGDTLTEVPNNYNYNWIGVSEVDESSASSWCMIESDQDGKIQRFFDKPKEKVNTNLAAIGLYFIKNYQKLKTVLSQQIGKKDNEFQLSSIFEKYLLEDSIFLKNFINWQDIGTLENYQNTNLRNFNCRYFNQLNIDELGTIKKQNRYGSKMEEIEWYRAIKNTSFKRLAPTVYNVDPNDSGYMLEYYDYLTLSEYSVYYPIIQSNNIYILYSLVSTMKTLYLENKRETEIYHLAKKMYFEKTFKRIGQWEKRDLVDREYIYVNDQKLIGFKKSMDLLNDSIERLCETAKNYNTIIHGDLSYANILYSPRNNIFKLIDPRGNYGVDTIYGDYRYDFSKLRHCYHGRYDEIVNDLYQLCESDCFELNFYKDNDYEIYDEILKKVNIDINDIELIEGLLFISMIPLHSDFPKRQMAFFLIGLICLNNQMKTRKLI